MNKMRNYFNPGNSVGNNGGMNTSNGPFGMFGNVMNVFNKFRQFMTNPVGYMLGSNLNIPQNIQNNSEAITNYLRSSGKMTEDQYNQSLQMAQMAQNLFGKKF